MANSDNIATAGVSKIIDEGNKITLLSSDRHDLLVTINENTPFDTDTMEFYKAVTGVIKIIC